MISFSHKGDFSKANKYLEKLRESVKLGVLDKYGRAGVTALSSATPIDSGLTASSWGYKIEHSNGLDKIIFTNTNINQGVPIAIIFQYVHVTCTGGLVQGRDYINPAIQPIFDQMVQEVWKEVTSV